jgi:hypothetical protein
MKRTSKITRYLSAGLLAAAIIAGVTRPAQSLDNGGQTGGDTLSCNACKTTFLPFQKVIVAKCVASGFIGATSCQVVTSWPAGTQSCDMAGSACVVNDDDGSIYIP